MYRQQSTPQGKETRYLGIISDGTLHDALILNMLLLKDRTAGVLRMLCNHKSRLRRDTLVMIYPCYVHFVSEFLFVLFSCCAAYKLHPIFLVETMVLRLGLGLPKYVVNSILHLEARFFALMYRFKFLAVLTFLKLFESPVNDAQFIFLMRPDLFEGIQWPMFQCLS